MNLMPSGKDVELADPRPGPSSMVTIDHVQHNSEKNAATVFEETTAPPHATEVLERWNSSRTNMSRFFSTLFSFIVLGANDAAFGALIPYASIDRVAFSTMLMTDSLNHTTISHTPLSVGYEETRYFPRLH